MVALSDRNDPGIRRTELGTATSRGHRSLVLSQPETSRRCSLRVIGNSLGRLASFLAGNRLADSPSPRRLIS